MLNSLHLADELVHRPRRLGAGHLADGARRHASDRHLRRHRLEHDGAGRDAGAFADLDIAEDLGAGADQDAAADFRMAVAALLAGAAEGHVLQDGDVVLDQSRLADDDAGGMIDEDALAHAHRRVDVDLEHLRGPALQIKREVMAPGLTQPMGETVRLEGVKALEIEHRLEEARAGGIAVGDGGDVGPEGLPEHAVGFDRLEIGLGDEVVRHDRVAEPRSEAMHHGRFQSRVVEDRRDDEARHGGLRRMAASASPRSRVHTGSTIPATSWLSALALCDMGSLLLQSV